MTTTTMTTTRIFLASTKMEDLGLVQVEHDQIEDQLRDLAAEMNETVYFRDPTTDKVIAKFNPKKGR